MSAECLNEATPRIAICLHQGNVTPPRIADKGPNYDRKEKHTITLIPGDGIGPDVTRAVLEIVKAAGDVTAARFEWESCEAGANAHATTGEHIPKPVYESIERNRVVLKGPLTTPIGSGFASINVRLRKEFELFANFRPVKTLPGVKSNYVGIDLVIIRENTEDLYAGSNTSSSRAWCIPLKSSLQRPQRELQSSRSSMRASTNGDGFMPYTKPIL